MHYASNICFICLKDKPLIKEYNNDMKHITELINYVLPELISEDFELPSVCAQCYDICKVFHTFKKICFQNYGRWKDYILHLQKDSVNKNELGGTSANLVQDYLDVVIKEEIIEDDSIHLEPVEHIKVENILENCEESNQFSEYQNVSECSFQDNFSENNQTEQPPFEITSVFSDSDVNYINSLDSYNKLDDTYSNDVNSLLIMKEKPTKKRKNKKSTSTFTCSVCDKNFSQYRYLKQHSIVHKTDKQYKCTKCDKEFRQNYHLSRHMKIHSEQKDHECPICQKKFRLKFALTHHMKCHENKEIKCEICNKIFLQEYYLKRHMKIHSGSKDFKCQHCDEEFVYDRYLKTHIKNKHSTATDNF